MLVNAGKWIARCVLTWIILNQGMSFAEDSDGLIYPATVVARVGGVDLTAGKILVQQGHDLNAWWRSGGADAETQLIVKERVVKNLDEAVRAELLRKAMVEMQERGGKAKADASRPTFELMIPIFEQELKTKYGIQKWATNTPEANSYIAEWLSTRVAARIMAGLIARKWYRQPERNAEAFAYWNSHQVEFTVLNSVTWRQITLGKDSPKTKEFNKLFNEEASDAPHIAPLSDDTFREDGELVRSEFPHPNIHPLITRILKVASVGDQHRVPIAGDFVYLRVEHAEHRRGTYSEVELNVKDKLAALHEEKIVYTMVVRNTPVTRIGLK